MGGAMLSESLIQSSVDVPGCVPSLLFDLRPSYGGGNEDKGDLLQKVPCRRCYSLCPDPAAGLLRPTPPLRLLDTHGQVGVSLVGSLLLPPGFRCIQGSVCALQESASCVSSGGSVLGLIVTSSKRARDTPRSAAPRTPAPVAGHC